MSLSIRSFALALLASAAAGGSCLAQVALAAGFERPSFSVVTPPPAPEKATFCTTDDKARHVAALRAQLAVSNANYASARAYTEKLDTRFKALKTEPEKNAQEMERILAEITGFDKPYMEVFRTDKALTTRLGTAEKAAVVACGESAEKPAVIAARPAPAPGPASAPAPSLAPAVVAPPAPKPTPAPPPPVVATQVVPPPPRPDAPTPPRTALAAAVFAPRPSTPPILTPAQPPEVTPALAAPTVVAAAAPTPAPAPPVKIVAPVPVAPPPPVVAARPAVTPAALAAATLPPLAEGEGVLPARKLVWRTKDQDGAPLVAEVTLTPSWSLKRQLVIDWSGADGGHYAFRPIEGDWSRRAPGLDKGADDWVTYVIVTLDNGKVHYLKRPDIVRRSYLAVASDGRIFLPSDGGTVRKIEMVFGKEAEGVTAAWEFR